MSVTFEDLFTAVIDPAWTKTDTGTKISIVSGRAFFNGGSGTWGDPGLRAGTYTRSAQVGGGFGAVVRLTNQGGDGPAVGLAPVTNPADPSTAGRGAAFTYPDLRVSGVVVQPTGNRLRSVDYLLVAIPRPSGGYLVCASRATAGGGIGVFPLGSLLWTESAGTDADLYAHLWNKNGVFYADYARVLDVSELPAALTTQFGAATAADTFNRASLGTTTEVGGKTYVTVGSPSISGNALSVPNNANFTFDPGSRGRWYEMTVNAAAAGLAFYFRNNGTTPGTGYSFFCDPGVTGIWNEGASGVVSQTGAISWSSGTHRLRILDEGTYARIFLDDQDVLGAVNLGSYGTQFGIGFTNYSGDTVTVEDVAAWPATISLPTSFNIPAPPVRTADTPISSDVFTGTDGTALSTYNAAWTANSGTWEIRSGRARMTTAAVDGAATRTAGAAGVDHEVSADILLPAATPGTYPLDWYAGLIVRRSAANSYIIARYLYQNDSPEVEVWENNAGAQSLIGYVNLGAGALAAASTHNLRLACNGTEVAAYHDGELVVQAATSVTTGTAAGMAIIGGGSARGQPEWDNLDIRRTTAPVVPSTLRKRGLSMMLGVG